MPTSQNVERVSPHGRLREGSVVAGIVVACVLGASGDDLERVPVEMEWVFPCVVVVQDDVDNVSFLEDESVRVGPVYRWVAGRRPGREHRVQGRDFWHHVCNAIEEGAVAG